MIRQLYFFSLIFWFTSSASAQFSIPDILDAPFPDHLTVSPDSEHILWVSNAAGVRNIWMIEDEKGAPKSLTAFTKDDGQSISNLIVRESESQVIFVRGGAPNRRGEIPNPLSTPHPIERLILATSLDANTSIDTLVTGSSPTLSPDQKQLVYLIRGQVWQYDFETKKANELFHIRGSAGQLSWSPDSKKLAFVSRRGDHSFVGVYDLSSESLTYISPSVDLDQQPVWSPDGAALAFVRAPNDRDALIFTAQREALPWSIWVHRFADEKTTMLWKAKAGMGSIFRSVNANHQLHWMADDRLIFPYEGSGWLQFWSIDTKKGNPAQPLTKNEDFEVQFAHLSHDRTTLLYSSNQGDINRRHLWQLKSGGQSTAVTPGKGIEWSPVITPKGNIYCLASTATTPAQVARVQDGLTFLTTSDSDFPASNQLVTPEDIIFTSTDGMEIYGQLFLPKNLDRTKKYPAAIFFHGGSRRQMLLGFHHRGYYHNAYSLNQYLASQGYVVLSVNYRSGIGYGRDFREALNYGAGGASEVQDVFGAGLYLQSLDYIDDKKIGLWGGSYGGYLTAMGLAKASDLFAAGVNIHGVTDWNVVIQNFIPSYSPNSRPEASQLALQSSLLPYLDGWRSPVLLIHGDDDRNVPFSETVDLAEELRRREVHVEQLVFPDEVHGFLLHSNWVKAYEATADFFDRHLK
ncbi:MAG: prolyl oligopeptidase family serine peptidase [Bacteroidota bacterium]